jgi:signal transduction histidine kinase/CheY-like chemotaxis protein
MSVALVDLDGRSIILGIARDISERKRAEAERSALEEQLRQAQKMEGIGRLAGGIAHDFNNLLTAIRGSASLALLALPEGEGPREDLEQIEQAADRAASLTRQLLAFARRTVLQPEVVDLGEIVRHLEPMLGRLIGEDVTLVTATPGGASCVLADPGRIEQVIVNLAVNASDAMPNGGTLTIEVGNADSFEAANPADLPLSDGPATTLSMTDTGLGMDATVLDHLFEPFFTTKGPGKGTGLGLATVYGIVRQSGGTVTVHSEVGHGSTFTIYLPRVVGSSGASAEPPRKSVAGGHKTGTILVVEDDTGVRRFASRVLETAGYQVMTASGGAAAIAEANTEGVQLLLTDVVMPGMSGREVASRLVARIPGLRVLYMSGHTDKGIVHDGVLEPDIEFLAKPFTAEELLSAVAKAMGDAARH